MRNFSRRVKRLERTVEAAALHRNPPEPFTIDPRELLAIHEDPKAIEAAQCFASACAAQIRSNREWARANTQQAIMDYVIRTDAKVRAGMEYLAEVHRAFEAASGIST